MFNRGKLSSRSGRSDQSCRLKTVLAGMVPNSQGPSVSSDMAAIMGLHGSLDARLTEQGMRAAFSASNVLHRRLMCFVSQEMHCSWSRGSGSASLVTRLRSGPCPSIMKDANGPHALA